MKQSMRSLILCLTLLFFASVGIAAELKKVVFGYSTIGAMAAGAWMAKEIGAYEKYGIDTELIYISSGPTVVQALLGGDVTGGIAATNAVIAAVLRGAPLVSVISTANRPYHRFWVRPEITRIEDLKGKVLGVTRFGSVTDNLTRMVLRKYGLESTVNVRQMGGSAEVGAAFQNKQIAGAVTSSLRVDASVQPRLLMKLEDLGFQYSMDVVAYSRDDMKRSPQVVEGYGARLYGRCCRDPSSEGNRPIRRSPNMRVCATKRKSKRSIRIPFSIWKKLLGWSRRRSIRF